MTDSIHITMLLRKPWRTPEGIARVGEMSAKLGFRLTTRGRVSICGKVSPKVFAQRWGEKPTPVAPTPPGEKDFGAPGGYTSEVELTVPAELAAYVEAISVVPPAHRLFEDPMVKS